MNGNNKSWWDDVSAPAAYSYNPKTMEFAGDAAASPSPLEPDVWHYPADCTTTPPPQHEQGFVRVWQDGEWHSRPDHRGEFWWTSEGEPREIDFIGDPREHSLLQVRAVTVGDVKAECRRLILMIMTEDQQRNTLAAGQAAVMQYGPDPESWPAPLRQRQQDAMIAWSEIERLRARSDEIEIMEPLPADISADDLWAAGV